MIVTDGVDRIERAPAAFAEDYFGVDEHSFEQMLVRCSRLASNLRFFDLDNQFRGTWDELFLSGEIFVLAQILATDIDGVEIQFWNSVDMNGNFGAAAAILSIAETLDGWQGMLTGSNSEIGQSVGLRISELIDTRLVGDLHLVAGWLLRNDRNLDSARRLAGFSTVWGLRNGDGDLAVSESSRIAPQQPESLVGQFRTFSKTLAHVKRVAETRWPAILSAGVANPALGLAVAFLQQFEKVQQRINKFSTRHRQFYYRDVLDSRPRSMQVDSAIIVIEPDGTREQFTIPAGTQFTAGRDESGKEHVYSADSDLLVRNGRIKSVQVLRVNRDPVKAPENILGYITAARTETVVGDGSEETVSRLACDAVLGLGIASPVLLSGDGERRFDVTAELSFNTDIADDLNDLRDAVADEVVVRLFGRLFGRYLLSRDEESAADMAAGLLRVLRSGFVFANDDQSLSLIEQYLEMDRQALFHFLLRNSFSLRLTTTDGWSDIEDFVLKLVAPENAETALQFSFTLPEEGPAVVNSNTDLHGVEAPASAPLLQLLSNPRTHFNPLSVFNATVLERVKIALTVTGATNLLVSNDYGAIDTSTTFMPFGPQPSSGAALFVGNAELAVKKPDMLCFDLEWSGLPSAQGGFASHYQHYGSRYRTRDFRAITSVLTNGRWHRIAKPMSTALFAMDRSSDRLQEKMRLPVTDLDTWQPADTAPTEPYSQDSRNGFVRLQLECPSHGFGYAEQIGLTASAIARNSKLKVPLPLPAQAYTPSLSRIAINYNASTVIDLSAELVDYAESCGDSVRHILPFGTSKPATAAGGSGRGLLPRIDGTGALLIGFTAGFGNGRLSLFIGIGAGSVLHPSAETPSIDWSYLRRDEWVPIERTRVTRDTTRGFLSSGIVVLDIPDDIGAVNMSMPSGCFWVKATPTGPVDRTGRIRSVRMGALNVVESDDSGDSGASDRLLSAASITEAVRNIPGVAKVVQPEASRGRTPAESPSVHAIRTSERLRHKQRAVTAWDYERLVLAEFSAVFKVKCFATLGMPAPASTADNIVLSPGDVLIVAVPRLENVDSKPSYGPVFDVDELRGIRDYVAEIAPPGATVHVRNPVYERIQVRCDIVFNAAESGGAKLRSLNDAIYSYLSPWRPDALNARFGWRISSHNVESFIRELPYVAVVSRLSLLHVCQSDNARYSLGDTARANDGDNAGLINPRVPWSLAMPFRQHSIHERDASVAAGARAAGINDLALGATFIL